MTIITTQDNLKTGLQLISRVVGHSQTLPILNHILLKVENGGLIITGTNLELGMETVVRCKVEKDGEVCVPFKPFQELIAQLPDEPITLDLVENELIVKTARYQTKLKVLSTEDFPVIPPVENPVNVRISHKFLQQGLAEVMFAASLSEAQPEISAVLCRFSGSETKFVATDRYRLAELTLPFASPTQQDFIIPLKTAQEILRILNQISAEEVDLDFGSAQISCKLSDTVLIGRLVDGQYPQYERIIPDTSESTVVISRNEFQSALRTAAVFSRGVGSVLLEYDVDQQVLKVSAQTQGIGEGVMEIPAKITGVSGKVLVNYRYIIDVVQGLSVEDLEIGLSNDSAPVIVRAVGRTDYLYLVMPVKV